MKFVKGIMVGTIVSAGAFLMYNGIASKDRKKLVKKGKKFLKDMGM